MTTSENVNELVSAFVKARAEFQPVKKTLTAKTGTYSYDYADLGMILDATVPALSKHGLLVSQATTLLDGGLILVTRLFHTSGQWLEATYPLSLYPRPQEQGSAITYARRYTLGALLGVAAEGDDDGQQAQQAQAVVAMPKPTPPAAKPEKVEPVDVTLVIGHAHVKTLSKNTGTSPKSGKPYTRWIAEFADGRDHVTTFDTKLGDALEDARDVGLRCRYVVAPAKKAGWFDLKTLELDAPEDETPPANEDPLPF